MFPSASNALPTPTPPIQPEPSSRRRGRLMSNRTTFSPDGNFRTNAFSSNHATFDRDHPPANSQTVNPYPLVSPTNAPYMFPVKNPAFGPSLGSPSTQIQNLVGESKTIWATNPTVPPLAPPPTTSPDSSTESSSSGGGHPLAILMNKKRRRKSKHTTTHDDVKDRRKKKHYKYRSALSEANNKNHNDNNNNNNTTTNQHPPTTNQHPPSPPASTSPITSDTMSSDEQSSDEQSNSISNSNSTSNFFSSSMSEDDDETENNSNSSPSDTLSSGRSNRRHTRSKPPPPSSKFIYNSSDVFSILGTDNNSVLISYLTPWEQYFYLTAPLNRLFKETVSNDNSLWFRACQLPPFRLSTSTAASSLVYTSYTRSFIPYRQMFMNFLKCFYYLESQTSANVIRENNKVNRNYQNRNQQKFTLPAFVTYGNPSGPTPKLSADRKNSKFAPPHAPNNKVRSTLSLPAVPTLPSNGSSITQNLYGLLPTKLVSRAPKLAARLEMINPAFNGLPFTSTIYSIANWMMFYDDVEGIVSACLSTLSSMLDDESQRDNAQRIGLTDMVLKSMCCFVNSVEIHEHAAKAIVTLARPIGGREGEVYELFMRPGKDVYRVNNKTGRFGIAVILDSMQRFINHWKVQSMNCWSLINISLIPVQKRILIKLGGIERILNSIRRHSNNEEVTFRAIFSLINLVSQTNESDSRAVSVEENAMITAMIGESLNSKDEMEIVMEHLEEIVSVVTSGMRRFKYSPEIVERGMQVLYNLSMAQSAHEIILFHKGGETIAMLSEAKQIFTAVTGIMNNIASVCDRLAETLNGNSLLNGQFELQMQERRRKAEAAHAEYLEGCEMQD